MKHARRLVRTEAFLSVALARILLRAHGILLLITLFMYYDPVSFFFLFVEGCMHGLHWGGWYLVVVLITHLIRYRARKARE
jgi:hypothetical protein